MSILSDRPPPVISDATAAIRSALRLIPSPDDDGEIRSAVAGAIKSALGTGGLPLWLEWSRKSKTHCDSSAELQWNLAGDQNDEELLAALAYLTVSLRCMAREAA